jgi:hypothetical protein
MVVKFTDNFDIDDEITVCSIEERTFVNQVALLVRHFRRVCDMLPSQWKQEPVH